VVDKNAIYGGEVLKCWSSKVEENNWEVAGGNGEF